MNKKIIIVIPVYNEEKQIKIVLENVRHKAPSYDVLVINDSSTDETEGILKELNVLYINLPFNTGYGIALQTGIKYAHRNQYDYLVQMDGDGQHEAACIKDILSILEKDEADIVIGSRFIRKNKTDSYKCSVPKRIGILILRWLILLITRQRITDPTSGFIGFNKKAISKLISDDYPYDYPDADVIIMMNNEGLRIKEIPVIMYNVKGRGKIHTGLRPIYYGFKMLLSILISVLRGKKRF